MQGYDSSDPIRKQILDKAIFPDKKRGAKNENQTGYYNAFNKYMDAYYRYDFKKIFFVVTKVAPEACIQMATYDWNQVGGFIAMRVAKKGMWNIGPLGQDSKGACKHEDRTACAGYPPMTVERAITACEDSTNIIMFTFR